MLKDKVKLSDVTLSKKDNDYKLECVVVWNDNKVNLNKDISAHYLNKDKYSVQILNMVIKDMLLENINEMVYLPLTNLEYISENDNVYLLGKQTLEGIGNEFLVNTYFEENIIDKIIDDIYKIVNNQTT